MTAEKAPTSESNPPEGHHDPFLDLENLQPIDLEVEGGGDSDGEESAKDPKDSVNITHRGGGKRRPFGGNRAIEHPKIDPKPKDDEKDSKPKDNPDPKSDSVPQPKDSSNPEGGSTSPPTPTPPDPEATPGSDSGINPADVAPNPGADSASAPPDPAAATTPMTVTRTQILGAAPPLPSWHTVNSNPNHSTQDQLYNDIYSRLQASVAKQKADPDFNYKMLYREAAKIVDQATDDAGLLGGIKNNLIRGTRIKKLIQKIEDGSQKITISGEEYTFAEAKQHGLLPRPNANRIAHLYAKAQMGNQTPNGQFIGQIKHNYQLEQIADKILKGDTKISIAGHDLTLTEAIDLGLFTPRTFSERLDFSLDTAKATTLYNAFSQAFSSNIYQNKHQPSDFDAKAYQHALDTFLPNGMPKTTPDGYQEFAIKFLKKQLPGYNGPADDLNAALGSPDYKSLSDPIVQRDQNNPGFIHFSSPANQDYFQQNPATSAFFLCPEPANVTSILEAFTSACESNHLPFEYDLRALPDHNDKIIIHTNAKLADPYLSILAQIRDDHPDWFAGSGANPLWSQIDGLPDVYFGATPKDPKATYTSKRAELLQKATTSWLNMLQQLGAINKSQAEALLKHQTAPTDAQIAQFTRIFVQTCANNGLDATNFALLR